MASKTTSILVLLTLITLTLLSLLFVYITDTTVKISAECNTSKNHNNNNDNEENQLPFNELFGTAKSIYNSDIKDKIIEYRRTIHASPELMYEEYKTSDTIYNALLEMGIDSNNIKRGIAITGIVAQIGFQADSINIDNKNDNNNNNNVNVPTVILRADMDALPIHEASNNDTGKESFRSVHDGVMHACGHDAHIAMLLGAAMVIKEQEQQLIQLGARVRFLFQPAEEGGAGALRMIQEGALQLNTNNNVENNDSDYGNYDSYNAVAIMLHVNPEYNVGTIASKSGVIMAGTARLEIIIKGVGGHAAYPHLSKDVIAAAGAIITGVHGLVSRSIAATRSAVVSLTFIDSLGEEGESTRAFNVLPEKVTLGGTVRALDESVLEQLKQMIGERVEKIADAFGCQAVIDFREDVVRTNSRGVKYYPSPYPPTINDPKVFGFGMNVAESLFGKDSIQILEHSSMAGEDFAFIANRIPSSMFWIGSKRRNSNKVVNLHSPQFHIDERLLARGAAFLSTTAIEYLRKVSKNNQTNAIHNKQNDELSK